MSCEAALCYLEISWLCQRINGGTVITVRYLWLSLLNVSFVRCARRWYKPRQPGGDCR